MTVHDGSTFRRLESHASGSGNGTGSGTGASSRPRLRVLLQVDGIHCPSCVEHINNLIRNLDTDARLVDVSVSYLDRTIIFYMMLRPDEVYEDPVRQASIRESIHVVIETLKEDGFQPHAIACKVIQDGIATSSTQTRTFVPFDVEAEKEQKSASSSGNQIQSSITLWKRFRHPKEVSKLREAERERGRRRQKHLSVCRSCRDGLDHDQQRTSYAGSETLQEQDEKGNTWQIDVSSKNEKETKEDDQDGRWQADLILQGLTCAACVSNVQKAAETVPGLESIEVNLMTSSARIVVEAGKTVIEVAEAIEDAGYGAEVVKSERVLDESITWQATFTVGGMTCASCVGNIERAVGAMPGKPLSFTVALMQGSASAIIEANNEGEAASKAKAIAEEIEDVGFECELQEIRQDKVQVVASASTHRTVQFRVEGMFCSHCVEKVRRYLQSHPSIDVDQRSLAGISLTNPIVAISYHSSTRDNARKFIADIEALNPAFQVQIVVPPSISSRSAQHARRELHSLLVRLVLAFLFVPPTLLIAVIVPTFLSRSHHLRISLTHQVIGQANRGDFILLALATPVQFLIGSIFYQRAFKSLRSVWRRGRSWSDRLISWGDMNVLVALGTSVAYFASLAFLTVDTTRKSSESEMDSSMTYFDACVFLVFFILFGRVLEAWSKRKTSSAVSALGSLRPSTGQLLLNPEASLSSAVKSVQVELLEVGDLVLIPSGSSPPLDCNLVGTASNPAASFLESAITGESRSVIKAEGDVLYSGTINQSKTAVIARVTTLAGSNLIDNVIEIVQSSSSRKADIEQLADKVTSHFVPIIVAISIITLIIWLAVLYTPGTISNEWRAKHIQNYQQCGAQVLFALQFAVSVLVVACPCGIGLAAPTAQIIAIGLASKYGILVQGGGQAFQSAVQLANRKKEKAYIFDKTGTITHGNDGSNVQEVHLEKLPGTWSEDALWKAVWLVEGNSSHPIAEGIRKWSENKADNEAQVQIDDIEEIAGRGLKATAKQGNLLIGSLSLIREQSNIGVNIATEMQTKVNEWQSKGASVVYIAVQPRLSEEKQGCHVVAALSMADSIRADAAFTIAALKERYRGQAWMVSGDTISTAKAIAVQVGITPDNVIAGVLPAEKAEWVEKIKQANGDDLESKRRDLKQKQTLTMFVGDGINDAPALSCADLSIALGSGSTLATSTASFILLNQDRPLASIPVILSLSKATQNKIWQNLAWACAFNLIFIPIAAGVFVQAGFNFGPSWSGLAMALSSVSVVLNALTLRLWRPPRMS